MEIGWPYAILLSCPKREGLADDFVQLGFGFAVAEGEGAREMFPIVR